MSTCIIYSIVIWVLAVNDPSEVKHPASNIRAAQAVQTAQTQIPVETVTK